jgi:type VI secretion system protein ImpC
MFGEQNFLNLPNLKDLKSLFEGPQYARWHSFRESEDSRYVGLCMPRFLLRLPYGEKTVPVKAFNFNEDVVGHHDRYLWGYASTALATRVAASFAKFRWSPNIIGPQSGGAVENLPLHQYEAMGEIQTKIPTEVLLTERREYELSEEGFIGLTFRKSADNAAFFSANSTQRPKLFGNNPEGKAAETNYRLGTQLPYMFIMTRLAHYIKVLQREQIGSWKERTDLERELNNWLSQYVADMDDPAPAVRSRRPLRTARVTVEDVEGQPGWYRCSIQVRPHFKYMGASFTLSLVGKLDKQ